MKASKVERRTRAVPLVHGPAMVMPAHDGPAKDLVRLMCVHGRVARMWFGGGPRPWSLHAEVRP